MHLSMMRGSSAVIVVTLIVAMLATVIGPAGASAPTLESGYIPLRDGKTQLKYTLMRPEGAGPLPTLLVYSGYGHREWVPEQYLRDPVLEGGYNLLVVSVRGSGCSGGTWEFLNQQEAEDGVDVIDWITRNPWSNGRVALTGASYAAMPQFAVAAEWATEHPDRSDGLVAIAPQSPISDIYRDVAYPGGIANQGFASGFIAIQGGNSLNSAAQGTIFDGSRDTICLQNQSTRPAFAEHNTFTQLGKNPWADRKYYERSPIHQAEKIDVPVFGFFAWQDQTLSGRAVDILSQLRVPFHAIVTNGNHASYWAGYEKGENAQTPSTDPGPAVESWRDFLDYYVRGIDNGFGEQGPVQVWLESNLNGDPGFTSSVGDWPAPQAKPMRLFLSEGGALQEQPGTGGPDSFVYSPSSQVPLNPRDVPTWGIKPAPEFVESYTSQPLTNDVTVLGSASVDLWLSSTEADTDVQATIIEVRPDGKEIYVQSGWLRASHRRLDEALSTETRPYQTHREEDEEALVPSQATEMRLEIFPFGHVFREDSRIRIEVGGPTFVPSGWRLETLPGPATNSIHHDQGLQSSLVLSTLPGHPAKVPSPPCEGLRGQPCR